MTLGTGFVKTGDLLRIRFCLHETFQPTANSIYLDTVELKWNSSNTEGHRYVFQYRLEGTKEERGFRERFLIVDKNENGLIAYTLLTKEKISIPFNKLGNFLPAY